MLDRNAFQSYIILNNYDFTFSSELNLYKYLVLAQVELDWWNNFFKLKKKQSSSIESCNLVKTTLYYTITGF